MTIGAAVCGTNGQYCLIEVNVYAGTPIGIDGKQVVDGAGRQFDGQQAAVVHVLAEDARKIIAWVAVLEPLAGVT